jgi:hypothetical protein
VDTKKTTSGSFNLEVEPEKVEDETQLSVILKSQKKIEELGPNQEGVQGKLRRDEEAEHAPDLLAEASRLLEPLVTEQFVSEAEYEREEDSLAEIEDNIWDNVSQAEDYRRISQEIIAPDEEKRAHRRVRIEETPVIIEDNQVFTSISESRFDTEDLSVSEELLELDEDDIPGVELDQQFYETFAPSTSQQTDLATAIPPIDTLLAMDSQVNAQYQKLIPLITDVQLPEKIEILNSEFVEDKGRSTGLGQRVTMVGCLPDILQTSKSLPEDLVSSDTTPPHDSQTSPDQIMVSNYRDLKSLDITSNSV